MSSFNFLVTDLFVLHACEMYCAEYIYTYLYFILM